MTAKSYKGNRKGKSADGSAAPGTNVMREFRIDFLSPVDRPAQAGALATILKRDSSDDPPTSTIIVKNDTVGIVTSVEDGHTHIVWMHGPVGETTMQMAGDADRMHDHPFSIAGGALTIHENDGHTHTVDQAVLVEAIIAVQKRGDVDWLDDEPTQKEHVMPEAKTTKSAEALESTVATLEANLALQGIIAGMNDSEKAHFATLDTDAAKSEFVSKASSDRAEEIADIKKAADASDPVVYTSVDGDVFRKSDDPRMVRAAQKADKAEKRAADAEAIAKDASYSKRAENELSALPGTVEDRTAIVKALDEIKDPAVRKQAFESLTAANSAMAKSFETGGTTQGGTEDESAPQVKLDAIVKAYAKENSVTEAAAYNEVLQTEEGKSLYHEMDQQ